MTAVKSVIRLRPARVCKHLVLIAVSFLSAFPFYWMVVSATNPSADVVLGRMLPGANLVENFKALADSGALYQAFFNSLTYSAAVTVGALLISSLAGYGFIIYRDKAKNFVMGLLLLSMMVPTAATLIPLFRFFSQMKLVNTVAGYMLPMVATAFLIFMFRQSAHTFPIELVQAARIDGLGEFAIFFRMFVPVMRPTYAAAATITFMNSWNAYLWPLVVLQEPSKITMPIFVAHLQTGYVLDYGMIMLGVTITTLPTLIVFFVLQKSFVEGILGSLK
jgi:lactose/L-arabinose transport system permease protein